MSSVRWRTRTAGGRPAGAPRAAPRARQVAEVAQQRARRARWRSTRGGTARPTAAASRCSSPITTSSGVHAVTRSVRGHRADDQRVVAHGREALRDAGEQAAPVVVDRAQPAVHHLGRMRRSRRRSTWASAWWPRQTPSTGTSARWSASSETPTSRSCSGRPGPGEITMLSTRQRRELLPRQLVVAHDDRLVAVDLAQQVEEVEGERVVVVDQERAHGRIYTLPTLAQERRAPILETVVTTINPDGSVNCAAMGVEWGERADRHQALPRDADAAQPARHRGRGREPDRRHPAVQPGGARRPASADPSGGQRRGRGAGRRLLVARGARRGDRRRRARARVSTVVVGGGAGREFLGLNRACHAVLEASILASRARLLDPAEIRAELQPAAGARGQDGRAARARGDGVRARGGRRP